MTEPAKKTAAAKPTGRGAAREAGDKLEEERLERIRRRDHPTPAEVWEDLTKPFPADWIEKLPKPLQARDDNKGVCSEHPPAGNRKGGPYYSADGYYCNKYHARAVHLDYVGHAGITMRLNDVLGPGGWDFKPYAHNQNGTPTMTGGEFYASLTIKVQDQEPVTKWDLAANFNGSQEAYGDALRRCAMRFGIGTYLWSRSDHAFNMAQATDDAPEPPAQPPGNDSAPPDDYRREQQAQRPPQQQERTPHAQQVYDMVSSVNGPVKEKLKEWWAYASERGEMPALANMDAVTPEQAAMVEDTLSQIIESQGSPDPQ